jgi:hypothetical protein
MANNFWRCNKKKTAIGGYDVSIKIDGNYNFGWRNTIILF